MTSLQSPGEGLGSCHLNCKRQCKTSITALVPADIHGLPKIKSSGPSPLIERWRLGGRCDCGGWDMGCALTLLHNRKQRRNNDLIETNSEEADCYSVYVLSKVLYLGTNHFDFNYVECHSVMLWVFNIHILFSCFFPSENTGKFVIL